jgi:plasmid stabilization system protein ParE
MPKPIVWSPESEKDLEKILDYLASEWESDVSIKFLNLIDRLLRQISKNPKQYPIIHKQLSIRKCVITKHNSLYYRNRRSSIELLRIYDNRQDPDNLAFKMPSA